MPDEDDLERRLWRTMLWDEKVMYPDPENETFDDDDPEEEGEKN
jgi:hypothetical protein